ncbi:hypothetical protein ACFS6H_20060 [Terrimonas rubra]|uniref:Uncharacterized protein n=1 Tax=Terrimonas rubra TaxID=1035890 RepID=A0ABW6AD82_9BACT
MKLLYKGENGRDEISHLIESMGIDKTICLHEDRVLYARNHPRNPFFIGAIQDSKKKLVTLKMIKDEQTNNTPPC